MVTIHVEKDSIIETLTIANEIAAPRQATPILSNIYLSVTDLTLSIRVTDLSISFNSTISIEKGEDGILLLLCEKLTHAIKTLPNGIIVIEQIDKSTARVYSDADKNVEYTLYCADESIYPKFISTPKNGYCLLPQKEFKSMIKKTGFAVSQDESHPNLNGIYLNIYEDSLVLVGTDGRRLSFLELKGQKNHASFKSEKGIIIPLKMLSIIEKYSGEGQIGLLLTDDNILFIQLYNHYFSSSLIDEIFPDYKKVIPEKQQYLIETDTPDLVNAIRQASLFSENTRRIILSVFENRLIIKSDQENIGKAKIELPCVYSGPDTKIALNYSFILNPLTTINEPRVIIGFTENDRALSLYPKREEGLPQSEMHVIAPMQLD